MRCTAGMKEKYDWESESEAPLEPVTELLNEWTQGSLGSYLPL